jgi:hypothetical protein
MQLRTTKMCDDGMYFTELCFPSAWSVVRGLDLLCDRSSCTEGNNHVSAGVAPREVYQ